MLDFPTLNQGSGLRQLAPHAEPTVVSVLHHGDRVAELTLLWQLCSALQAHGYGVTVLDGTAQESPANTGLLDMLDSPYSPHLAHQTGRWAVVPSALGLAQLRQQPQPAKALARLEQLVPDEGVLVIYASAEDLSGLATLQKRNVPLLSFTPEVTSLLSAYQSIKELSAWSRPQEVIAVTVSPLDSPQYLAESMAKSLQNCTMNFLKCPVRHVSTQLNMVDFKAASLAPEGIRQLALQLLNPQQVGAPVAAPVPRPTAIATKPSLSERAATAPRVPVRPKASRNSMQWSQ